jgi:6-phosphogluconolactonase
MLVVVMGVSGSGKTTIGMRLAEALGCAFLDADVLHPDANVDAMKNGRALTDADREPWLTAIHARLRDHFDRGQPLVVACSALKHSYRRVLSHGISVTWVYLKGNPEVIRRRLDRRTNHFMPSALLDSQIRTLEEPVDAITVDIALPPDEMVGKIMLELRDRPDIRVLADLTALSHRVAETVAAIINDTVRHRGRCSLGLSGGSTPVTLHRLLATSYRARIPWSFLDVFWGDERYVPHDDPHSNYRMARETLLDHVPCPAANVYPMPTHFPDPDDAAWDYQATLERYWAGGKPQLDLVLLGMGPDGHTASLFPGSSALDERIRLVMAVTAPAQSPRRLTLTFPAFARSAHIHFLVSGADKAVALSQVLSGADRVLYPAAGVRAAERSVVWWLDRDAASALTFE